MTKVLSDELIIHLEVQINEFDFFVRQNKAQIYLSCAEYSETTNSKIDTFD